MNRVRTQTHDLVKNLNKNKSSLGPLKVKREYQLMFEEINQSFLILLAQFGEFSLPQHFQ